MGANTLQSWCFGTTPPTAARPKGCKRPCHRLTAPLQQSFRCLGANKCRRCHVEIIITRGWQASWCHCHHRWHCFSRKSSRQLLTQRPPQPTHSTNFGNHFSVEDKGLVRQLVQVKHRHLEGQVHKVVKMLPTTIGGVFLSTTTLSA